jgi:hypothetical protein
MHTLSKNWITEGLIDFEYKKYQLLAWLQHVEKAYLALQIYPHLSELVEHYRHLTNIRLQKKALEETFPQELSGIDLQALALAFQKKVPREAILEEIDEIISFALPNLKEQVEKGKDLYEMVEDHLEIEPVGIAPLHQWEGYFFLSIQGNPNTYVYRYSMSLFQNNSENYRGIYTEPLVTYRNSLSQTKENYKLQLIKKYPDLPNPSTFSVNSKLNFPVFESVLPVAKRGLVKYISTQTEK